MTEFDRTTIDEVDLAKYDRLGEDWWDPDGPMGALHKFNPVRVDWITQLASGVAPATAPPTDLRLAGLRILDVGCGGGILAESLARRGATVTGIDPAPNNIAVASRHAERNGLAIAYRPVTVDVLASAGEQFDVVLAMEVVEHVKDVPGFLQSIARTVRPGGLFVGATLNRTAKSYALAIVGAEYILRWLPRGTHDWHQFVTPAEFERDLRRCGLSVTATSGVSFNPLRNAWHASRDLGCNYMLAARKAA